MAPPPSPRPGAYRPARAIERVADFLADPVEPAAFPQHRLRFRNDRWAAAVGLADLPDARWIDHFGRFESLPDGLPRPLALRYHGHQFRFYNPDLGDGRGFLFAQLCDGGGRLLDLGTKGSGTTPWSRAGDGRLTLKGGVREILATEMLEALGVDTSRTFSLIETGEALMRGDEPSPTRSAVLVRLGHGHIRIGSFQRLAHLGELDALRRLTAYVLEELYGEAPGRTPEAQLFAHVVARAATLAASYMAAGFVHGVLNSDNINVTGESFDYGPWRFAPRWDAGFTAAYFDHAGLYAFGRQAQAIHWNVVQLAVAFGHVVEVETLAPLLDAFPAAYERALVSAMLGRLGVAPRGEGEDLALLQAMEAELAHGAETIDGFFFRRRGSRTGGGTGELDRQLAHYTPVPHALDHPYWTDPEPCSMHIEEVEEIWAAIDRNDDWAPLEAKVKAIRRMGDAHRAPA